MYKSCLLPLILFFAITARSSATDYYIDDTGIDGTGCGSLATPCLSLSYVLANLVTDGDTIFVMPGNYIAATQMSGSYIDVYASNITITAHNKNNLPYFQGTDSQHLTVRVRPGADNFVMSYLRIRSSVSGYGGGTPGPVYIEAENATIDHNELSHGGTVVLFRSNLRHHSITNNHLHHCCWGGSCTGQQDCHLIALWEPSNLANNWSEKVLIANNTLEYAYGDGLQFAGNVRYVEISNNTFRYFGENALDFKGINHIRIHGNDFSHACQRETVAPGTDSYWNQYDLVFATKDNNRDEYEWYVWNNVFHDSVFGGIGLNDNDGRIENWYVWNNVYYNLCTQPRYGCSAVNVQTVTNAHVTHNTIYNVREVTDTGNSVAGIRAGSNGDNIQNNLIYNSGDDSSNDNGPINGSSGTPDYNYTYSANRGDYSCAGSCFSPGPNDIHDPDPGFMDLPDNDFRLNQTSVNIDKGVAVSVSGDYDTSIDRLGTSRGSLPDIGAHEYPSYQGVKKPESPDRLRVLSRD
jgi:hypothetical protein